MIDFEEAKKLIQRHCCALPTESVSLQPALGCVSAEDIFSPINLPSFINSAMDGFVIASNETLKANPDYPIRLKIAGEVKAGDAPSEYLRASETKKIMTGAPVPVGADAVLEKEKAVVKDGFLYVAQAVPMGRHVRRAGEELKKGELALAKKSVINPGTLGFLAAMGLDRVSVFRKPKISLITTGSELARPGTRLRPGQIYDSNTTMIHSALQEMKIKPILIRRLSDSKRAIQAVLRFSLNESDLVILMGGVSVGDYDFVKELLQEEGAKTIFWKVRQKPGKPLYFGKRKETLVFGLPGNPASVFTCFYEYVYPAIRMLMGYKNPYLCSDRMKLEESVRTDPDKILFLKGKKNAAATAVAPLKRQKSHMLSSLCEADSFVVLPSSETAFRKGEKVLVHSLPYS